MHVHVKDLRGEVLVIEVNPTDTVMDLKAQIRDTAEYVTPTHGQKLVPKKTHKLMRDGDVIADSGIEDGDVIHLIKSRSAMAYAVRNVGSV